ISIPCSKPTLLNSPLKIFSFPSQPSSQSSLRCTSTCASHIAKRFCIHSILYTNRQHITMDRVQDSPAPSNASMASENHLTQQNSRSGEFPCLDCGKILSRRDSLLRHSRIAHGSGGVFWCQEGGCVATKKGFKRFHDYRKHMRTVHSMTVTPESVPSRRAVRRSRRNVNGNKENEHNEAVDQASPQVIQPVAQAVAQVSVSAPIPQFAPQVMRQVAPQGFPPTFHEVPRHTIPTQPIQIPTYVPDLMYDGQPMFMKSEGFRPSQPTINPPAVERNRQFSIEFRAEGRAGYRALTVINNYNLNDGGHEQRGPIRMLESLETQALIYQDMRQTYERLEQDRRALVLSLRAVKQSKTNSNGSSLN
ncbi:hypothetical protein F4803DRAFT_571643, partial [Xylaria telfairii]